MVRFKGSIKYTENTIHVLYKVAYETYEMRRMILRMVIGFIMAIAGLFLELSMIFQGILLMGGAWFMVSKDFPAKIRASEAIEKRGDYFPTLITEFHESFMILKDGKSMKLDYKKIEHLVEEDDLIFLFLSKDSAVVIERDSLEDVNVEEFKTFLEDKTNLVFYKTQSWIQMSFRDLYLLIKKS